MFRSLARRAQNWRTLGGGAIALAALCVASATRAAEVIDRVDWPTFMARQDLVWKRPPAAWESGAFMGNGQLGANVFAAEDGKSLKWHVGRTDVIDRGNRIPIGEFLLKTAGALAGADLRLDLWNAELTGKITTDKGVVGVRSFTHAVDMVQVIVLTPDAAEADCHWEWTPGLAVNPRHIHNHERIPENERNPEPQLTSEGDVLLAIQPLTSGGGHVTAWKEIRAEGGARVLLASVGFSATDIGVAQREAIQVVSQAAARGLDDLAAAHRAWWHNFWPASFVSFPDARLESFYWIQMYKMASGTRADRPLLDLMGPWFRDTPWPRIWWNLNIQLTYWPQLASNRLELGESLLKALDDHHSQLAANAKPYSNDSYAIGRSSSYDLVRNAKPEIGDLTWTLHNYYLQYRYSMDDGILRERLFPLLKGSVNYYLHLLKEGDDGKLHIPLGLSPEYPNQPNPNPDCNYDLALLRWGCQTLLDVCQRLKIEDPLIPRWKETLEKLAPYPTDENGLMISPSTPFKVSHRHYSHLLMIYPLHTMSLEQPENRALVEKSLNHWMGLESALRGYSYTGASSISSLMGRGDDALMYLNKLLTAPRFAVHPNTMYTEAGPVVETPLSAAASIHDMLLTSWGDKIRVFPAVPKAWNDVTFRSMRTEGAFLVTAARRTGKTQFIRIESLAGEPCRLVTDMEKPVSDGAELKKVAEHEYELSLNKGEAAVITPKGATGELVIEPVTIEGPTNPWGLSE
jgi:alpha-L-fucosidase 2